MLKNLYNKFWDWCKNSGTILIARINMIGGLLVASLGSLDWTALLSYGTVAEFNWKNAVILGGIMFTQGLITEIVRRSGTVEANNKLLPAEVTLTEAKAIEIKK